MISSTAGIPATAPTQATGGRPAAASATSKAETPSASQTLRQQQQGCSQQ